MLYEALSQPTIFLVLSLGGFVSGFWFDLETLLSSFFKQNKTIKQILLFFACFFTLFICFLLNLFVNFGQFRFFAIFAFALAFSIERFLMKNFVAYPLSKCYNKLKGKLKNERKKKA